MQRGLLLAIWILVSAPGLGGKNSLIAATLLTISIVLFRYLFIPHSIIFGKPLKK